MHFLVTEKCENFVECLYKDLKVFVFFVGAPPKTRALACIWTTNQQMIYELICIILFLILCVHYSDIQF